MYESIKEYSDFSRLLLKDANVNAYPVAVTADGKPVLFFIDGLRTSARNTVGANFEESVCPSVSIESLIETHGQIGLTKLNIEGAEFEILEQLIKVNKLAFFNFFLYSFTTLKSHPHLKLRRFEKNLRSRTIAFSRWIGSGICGKSSWPGDLLGPKVWE